MARKDKSGKKASDKKLAKKQEKEVVKGAKAEKPEKPAKKREPKAVKPKAVKTGRGASPAEVAAGVMSMLRAKAPEEEIWKQWFSSKLVSIEGQMGQAWHGLKAVRGKAQWWYSMHRVHGMEIDGPFVGATGFGVRYTIDVEEIATGKRMKGDELAFYTVHNGKVVQEEFMGRAMSTPAVAAAEPANAMA